MFSNNSVLYASTDQVSYKRIRNESIMKFLYCFFFFFLLLQSTAVQGSKLRLPGYLSGKGFQSGEEGTLINAAVLKARTQTIGGEWKKLRVIPDTF